MKFSKGSYYLHKLLDQNASVCPSNVIMNYFDSVPSHDQMNQWVFQGHQEYGLVVGVGNFRVLKFDLSGLSSRYRRCFKQEYLYEFCPEVDKLVVQTADNGFQVIYRSTGRMIVDPSFQSICSSPTVAIINAPGYEVIWGSLGDVGWLSEEGQERLIRYSEEFCEAFAYTSAIGW